LTDKYKEYVMAAARKKMRILTKAQRLVRERAIIHDLRAGEMSYRSIAIRHGVSLPTVNAKARKAGIHRRPGKRVMAKAARRPKLVAKTKRTVARKVTRRVRRRRTVTRARKMTRAASRPQGRFQEQFRALIMSYYPNISLAKFDRLAKQIAQVIC
jgi:hypothetical protein